MAEAAEVDPISRLPLPLLASEPIAPAPNRFEPPGSSIDWLPDFAGYSWIAYGASSLLVISHFPSPLSSEEAPVGPIFRQVLELSGDDLSAVNAVSWSPVLPSMGELAAAAGNCIWVFSHDLSDSRGSFCWRQNSVLVQSLKVEAVQWTGAGDGIIAGGLEVILWKNLNRSWEIAWKFKPDVPQTLVSASWSIEGPFATASYGNVSQMKSSTLIDKGSRSVLVSQSEGKSGFVKSELSHPLPISMIQWRPLIKTPESVNNKRRQVLLTCCLDGTVRLWTEIEEGRIRKFGKDTNNKKSRRRHFSVSAVIEINQALNGSLGMDLFVSWATDIRGLCKSYEVAKEVCSSVGFEHDMAGNCGWIIGLGPGSLVTFWAVHCLDDVSPLRFPRVKLWKKQELKGFEVGHCYTDGCKTFSDLLKKVVISRIHLSGPPSTCSLIQLLPSNSLVWSLLSSHASNDVEDASLDKDKSDDFLCSSTGQLNLNGHVGKVLHVTVHPFNYEVEIAASLDSNGLLLFWTLSSISSCVLGPPTLSPTWELCGELVTQDSCTKYTSVQWAPSLLDEELILLMGHARGIDFFLVRIRQSDEENTECYYLCTIPFTGHGPFENGPTNIFSIPLPSDCSIAYKFNKFMLLGIWIQGFEALSWEITLHAYDISGTEKHCNCDIESEAESSILRFESPFGSKIYCVSVIPCSSHLPDSQIHDQITSFAVVHPRTLVPVRQEMASFGEPCVPAYVMATGCADGSLKLWRSNRGKPLAFHMPWELVSVIFTHQGPITGLSLTDCGQKIATIGKDNQKSNVSNVHIWELAYGGAGTFLFEDKLSFESNIVAVNWLTLGNGQFLLGVCLPNELNVYCPKRFDGQTLLSTQRSLDIKNWVCIGFVRTLPSNSDFLWGPKTAALIIHDYYFCIVSPWLFHVDKNHDATCSLHFIRENKAENVNGTDAKNSAAVFTDDSCSLKSLSGDCCNSECRSRYLANFHMKNGFTTWRSLIRLLDVVDKLSGSLSSFHPEAALINIYSGKWKRAHLALCHLIDYLSSTHFSEKQKSTGKPTCTVPEILLSDYFDGGVKSSSDKDIKWSKDYSSSQLQGSVTQWTFNWEPDSNTNSFIPSSAKSELSSFIEPLEKFYDLAGLTSMEKTQILAIVDLLGEIHNQSSASAYESLDEPGRRYWVALRFQQLHILRQDGRSALLDELAIDSRMIGWAYHSECQENLLDSVISSEPTWQEMRRLGVGIWFTNTTQLRTRMEKLARSQYLKRKDPKDCMLLYVILNRIQVLAGLFKISRDEKDKPLVVFLSRNFQEEKNKAAALKNAYVLMGKHQLEMAIAFFLLGGDTYSAISVCARNLGDEQLALVICRLVEGHGGPLEQHLITKFMLPSAIEKGDIWLATILEWELGNYSQSFLNMLGSKMDPVIGTSFFSSKHISFLDPSVGMYCLMLATKNSMKKAVGEQYAAVLSRLATLMVATALRRCGLPLEALEHLSTCGSIPEVADQSDAFSIQCFETINKISKQSPKDSSSWLSVEFAVHLEHQAKLDRAIQYLSILIQEHPSWPFIKLESVGCIANEMDDYAKSLENFQYRLRAGLSQFELKFSMLPASLVSMMLIFLSNHGLQFIANDIFHGFTFQECLDDKNQKIDPPLLRPLMLKSLLKTARDISVSFSRYTIACTLTPPEGDIGLKCSDTWWYYLQGHLLSLQSLRAAFRIICGSLEEDLLSKLHTVLDLIEHNLYFASAWLLRDSKCILKMLQPLLVNFTFVQSPHDIDMKYLKQLLSEIGELIAQNLVTDYFDHQVFEWLPDEQNGDIVHSVPGDERWHIIGACLWQYMSRFMRHKLTVVANKTKGGSLDGTIPAKFSTRASFPTVKSDWKDILENAIESMSSSLSSLMTVALTRVSSYQVKQLVSHLHHKLDQRLYVASVVWLEQFSQSQPKLHKNRTDEDHPNMDLCNKGESEVLWNIISNPSVISEWFAQEKVSFLHCLDHKLSEQWSDIYNGTRADEKTSTHESGLNSSSASDASGSLSLFHSGKTLVRSDKDLITLEDAMPFQKPREICKRNGELLEALCINSVDQRQAALASNKKGIVFFSYEDGMPFRDEKDFVWLETEWPRKGWAGSESTPAPTCVSPGVGLGSQKGAHLGLGGATVGVGSLARPGRDLTGGGAFGIPGYAGIGASGLGWETQEDFEDFVDPPATAEHTSTRAFSSHPSRPLFLVGSTNTHVYLWEFGKGEATATYGVLPAANVPPPYALASISSVQFDQCGHRFATAALDGTVCSWQLEVGGRSNVRPSESSLCFNGHASDVTYVTSSGSIIAVAGYSSTAINVIIWDTLAPPTTSRASIMCHEGGARSISVFDNEIGSGSISPLIVTGGKGGDVGVHDFRYVVTGRTKKHKSFLKDDRTSDSSSTSPRDSIGEKNFNGMLWYIPKAHSGSVTKISSIPNTSLFLTGSKDGDVKLWDAKRANLVYHWPKLHDRHTFLQPSSRGFGEVVRAAVTDIQVVSHGFLTCGGDGSVKLVQFK